MANDPHNTPVTPNPWGALRSTTSARIALGRAGGSLPTREWLDFKAAHAAAREAVHYSFDAEQLAGEMVALGSSVEIVSTAALDRRTFLERPDLGRQLDDLSRKLLSGLNPGDDFDLVVVVSDGLSAIAAHRQAVPLLAQLLPILEHDRWRLAPIIVARFGRVALEDEIGQILRATLALMLIGERPGLGSPDSLGAYLVFDPRVGNTDASRNCVSNIRPEGLSHAAAADTIHYLLSESRRRQISGVQLKDQRALANPASKSRSASLPAGEDAD